MNDQNIVALVTNALFEYYAKNFFWFFLEWFFQTRRSKHFVGCIVHKSYISICFFLCGAINFFWCKESFFEQLHGRLTNNINSDQHSEISTNNGPFFYIV